MNAHSDPELNPWLLNVINGNHELHVAPAGDFLKGIATAALRADPDNYAIMRPMLLEMKLKYPVWAGE